MKILSITAQPRHELGKKTARKRLIEEGLVPGILYGGATENLPFYVSASAIQPLAYTVCFIELQINDRTERCILQAKQVHPVSGIPIHIDLLRIFEDKPITMDIPLALQGKSIGVMKGGVLIKKIRKLKVKALPNHMPSQIAVDVTALDLGKVIRVNAVESTDYTILNMPSLPIVAMQIPRALRSKGGEQATATATTA